MIHDVFDPIKDRGLAEACSEMFLGDYRVVQSCNNMERYDEGTDFLRRPGNQLLCVQVDYLETGPDRVPRQPLKFAALGDLPARSQTLEEYEVFIGAKQRLGMVPPLVDLLESIPQFSDGGWEAIDRWMGGKVRDSGGTLVVAHTLSRSQDGSLTNALIYPRHLQVQLGLLARDVMVSRLPRLPRESQEALRQNALHNTVLFERIGDIAASNQLLPSERFRELVGPHLKA